MSLLQCRNDANWPNSNSASGLIPTPRKADRVVKDTVIDFLKNELVEAPIATAPDPSVAASIRILTRRLATAFPFRNGNQARMTGCRLFSEPLNQRPLERFFGARKDALGMQLSNRSNRHDCGRAMRCGCTNEYGPRRTLSPS
jgi:hypothetical protein